MITRKNNHCSAVSEILGTVLMLTMSIALFSIVSSIILGFPYFGAPPQLQISGTIDGADIIFHHYGGPSLSKNTVIKIVINDVSYTQTINEILYDNNNNGKWDIGEHVVYHASTDLTGYTIFASVIDVSTSSVIMYGTLQEGVSLATTILPIQPYTITTSTLRINALGGFSLDYVTLYYRWSANNWTEPWVILTYDDFETDFGNYTDGGVDCSRYSGGTYAHNGRAAINIQDNSGDSSSFFTTNNIDVAAPGYTSLLLDFWYQAWSMEAGEDFWVQYYNGSSWITIKTYASGTDFINNQFYHERIWINESSQTFPTNMKIKFICDASDNNDDIYIDQIYINATGAVTIWSSWNDTSNPDSQSPWFWDFDFPMGNGYYEFYSIGTIESTDESPPADADTSCYYNFL